jgi:hypothetical protein
VIHVGLPRSGPARLIEHVDLDRTFGKPCEDFELAIQRTIRRRVDICMSDCLVTDGGRESVRPGRRPVSTQSPQIKDKRT